MTRGGDRGMVLVTILVVMALCVTVIVAMTTRAEQATRTTGRGMAAVQAMALLTAGEDSALAALAADLQTAPAADGLQEPWARVTQQEAALTLGQFSLVIRDEAARFNLNAVTDGTPAARQALADIVAAAALPPEVAARIAAALSGGRMVLQTGDLGPRAGLSAAEIAALQPFVTCNPVVERPINVNTASEQVLAAVLRNPALTRRLVDRRATDLLTPAVLQDMAVILPVGVALRSDFYGVQSEATVQGATLRADALIRRWTGPDGMPHAAVIGRRVERTGAGS